jgi:hypothetical protein
LVCLPITSICQALAKDVEKDKKVAKLFEGLAKYHPPSRSSI